MSGPPRYVFTDADDRVLLLITREGEVVGDIDDAGQAGRVFMRAIAGKLDDYLYDRDRPARAAAIERAYDVLKREAQASDEKTRPGLVAARRVIAALHPEKEWRMRH